jgi:cell division protease FtsH
MSDKKRKLVAYHEAGHALVGALMPEYDPVTKISIVPRGAAGGLTFFAPSEERLESGLYSRTYFENQVSIKLNEGAAFVLVAAVCAACVQIVMQLCHLCSLAKHIWVCSIIC